tara:strand:+ start:1764 stop:2063 length:300 start_codon:yes stop_codon:yes gene_type:complete
MTSEDIARVKRGPADLEERIEQLLKQKEILKSACKKAGARIKELETELATIKGIGMNSPEMREAKAEIEKLKADLARAEEDHQYDNLVHKKELEDLSKK